LDKAAYRNPVPLEPGLAAEITVVVGDADTAAALGSGQVAVLGTPRIVALVEQAARLAIESRLGPGMTSVGSRVQLDHLHPTAVGRKVRAEARLERVEGHRLTFAVAVHDDRGLVAAGKIGRVVVETERFLEKCR
jgi:predicted thioesterase